MEIKNRLFPYPVLCNDTDDYVNSRFQVSVDVTQGFNELSMVFHFELDNTALQSLINKGQAYFAIHFECSKTAYRKLLKTQQKSLTFNISTTKINGDIALIGAIIAGEDIPYYKNGNLNDDYKESEIFIPKAAFMAYENMPRIRVTKNYEELQTSESMFSIVRRTTENGMKHPMEFDLGMEKIRISVNEESYRAYLKYSMNDNTQGILWSLLLMPAIVHMIDRLRSDGISAYENCDWYIKLSNQYRMQGLNFDEIVEDLERPVMQIAQEMLQMPIDKAFINMGMIMGSEEE